MIPVVVCHVVKLIMIPVVVCHVVWVPVLVEAALAELLLGLGLVANHCCDIFSLKTHIVSLAHLVSTPVSLLDVIDKSWRRKFE